MSLQVHQVAESLNFKKPNTVNITFTSTTIIEQRNDIGTALVHVFRFSVISFFINKPMLF